MCHLAVRCRWFILLVIKGNAKGPIGSHVNMYINTMVTSDCSYPTSHFGTVKEELISSTIREMCKQQADSRSTNRRVAECKAE